MPDQEYWDRLAKSDISSWIWCMEAMSLVKMVEWSKNESLQKPDGITPRVYQNTTKQDEGTPTVDAQ